MFTNNELTNIQRTVETLDNWDSIKWKPDENGSMLFSITPNGFDYDGTLEIVANDMNEFQSKVRDAYEAFDPDYETSLWIGEDGHGSNGAPYHIRDILEEMEKLDVAYHDLAVAFG